MTLRITPFFDTFSSTLSYVLDLGDGGPCAIIDPVLDYDPKAGRTSHESARKLIAHVHKHRLQLEWISAAEGIRFAETMQRMETLRRTVTAEEIVETQSILSKL